MVRGLKNDRVPQMCSDSAGDFVNQLRAGSTETNGGTWASLQSSELKIGQNSCQTSCRKALYVGSLPVGGSGSSTIGWSGESGPGWKLRSSLASASAKASST